MVAINLEKLNAITTNQKITAKLDHIRKRSFSNGYAADIQKEISATNDFEPQRTRVSEETST